VSSRIECMYLPLCVLRLADCELFADGTAVVSATWANTSELQTLRFNQPVTTRTLRMVIKSEVNGNPFVSFAGLDVLVQ